MIKQDWEKIAEIREVVTRFIGARDDVEYDQALDELKVNAGEWVPFLLSELERIHHEWISPDTAQKLLADIADKNEQLDREREENRKLLDAYNKVYENSMNNYSQLQSVQQDREKLIDALQTIRTDTEDPYTSEFAKKTLKQIGVNVE